MHLVALKSLPDIRLYAAHERTGLWRLGEGLDDSVDPSPPYWAYAWAGGLVLARYLRDRPDTVRGRRVLDLGTGSGLVGIVAARAGAQSVMAADIDPFAVAAARLNAAANGVEIEVTGDDLVEGGAPEVDVILAGDVFYDEAVGARMLPFLDRCLAAGIEVLVGDPHRTPLPRARLQSIAEYGVPDMGDSPSAEQGTSAVFRLLPPEN
jgi:predicted nicotinamide N-methyase